MMFHPRRRRAAFLRAFLGGLAAGPIWLLLTGLWLLIWGTGLATHPEPAGPTGSSGDAARSSDGAPIIMRAHPAERR